jgi:hypothetical protein
MAAPPTPILTPEPTPSPTPDQPVPMFGLTQQPTPTLPPLFGQIAPQWRVQPSPTTSEEGGEGGQDTQSRTILLTGGCIPFIKTNCVPCDPELPGGDCIPACDWSPVSTTDEDTSHTTQPPVSPTITPPLFGRNDANILQGGGLFGQPLNQEPEQQSAEEEDGEAIARDDGNDDDDDGPMPPGCPLTGIFLLIVQWNLNSRLKKH